MSLQRFAQWCLHRWNWWYQEVSYAACTHIGAEQLGTSAQLPWAKPIHDAFIAGCWTIQFTDRELLWSAKPAVHVEEMPGGWRRPHSGETAAIESDIERLYFWHGILVPAFVIVRPEWITLEHIQQEENAEVRRVMMERYGYERYIADVGAKREQGDDYGDLYRVARADDSDVVMIRVINSTPELDGSSKEYWLRVPPSVTSAREGVAWSFSIDAPDQYAPLVQT